MAPLKKITPKKETPVKTEAKRDPTDVAKEVAQQAIAVVADKPAWLVEMEAAASALSAQAGGDFLGSISTEGGQFSADGNKLKSPLSLVVLDAVKCRTYYAEAWKKGTKATPICYAYGDDEDSCAPHADAPDKQSASCKLCEHNAWGSDGGKGKSCKTRVKLAVVLPTDDPESAVEAEIRTLSVPTGTLKKWGQYLSSLKMVTPLSVLGVVTEVGVEPMGGGFGLTFRAVGKLAIEQVGALRKRAEGLREKMTQPYSVAAEEPKPAPRTGKRKF